MRILLMVSLFAASGALAGMKGHSNGAAKPKKEYHELKARCYYLCEKGGHITLTTAYVGGFADYVGRATSCPACFWPQRWVLKNGRMATDDLTVNPAEWLELGPPDDVNTEK